MVNLISFSLKKDNKSTEIILCSTGIGELCFIVFCTDIAFQIAVNEGLIMIHDPHGKIVPVENATLRDWIILLNERYDSVIPSEKLDFKELPLSFFEERPS